MTIRALVQIETFNNQVIELLQVGEEYRIDSREVAPNLGIEHQTFLETLQKYQSQLEHFGLLRFETDAVKTPTSRGIKYAKYVMLNRNQVLFAITLSRNTEQVIEWKMALIDALDQLERQVQQLPASRHHRRRKAKKSPMRVFKPISSEQLDECILTSVPLFKHRYGVWPGASEIRKYYFRYRASVEMIRDRVQVLVEQGVLQAHETPHTVRYSIQKKA